MSPSPVRRGRNGTLVVPLRGSAGAGTRAPLPKVASGIRGLDEITGVDWVRVERSEIEETGESAADNRESQRALRDAFARRDAAVSGRAAMAKSRQAFAKRGVGKDEPS